MNTYQELEADLQNHLENLCDLLNGFNFLTKDGLDLSDLNDGIDGFKKFAIDEDIIDGSPLLSSQAFIKKIKHQFVSEDDELSAKDFDWDLFEQYYISSSSLYKSYENLRTEIEDNLTGSQTIDSVELLSIEEMKDKLLEIAEEKGLIYRIGNDLFISNEKLDS